jgi:hypothetical protein
MGRPTGIVVAFALSVFVWWGRQRQSDPLEGDPLCRSHRARLSRRSRRPVDRPFWRRDGRHSAQRRIPTGT